MNNLMWIAAGALSLLMAGVAGHESAEVVEEEVAALSSRDFAAQQACGGSSYTWENDKTLVCHKELP